MRIWVLKVLVGEGSAVRGGRPRGKIFSRGGEEKGYLGGWETSDNQLFQKVKFDQIHLHLLAPRSYEANF